MSTPLRTLRQAIRSLLHNISSTVVTILVLTLAIGAATAIFSVMNAALLRPLPGVAAPERLVLLQRIQGGQQLGNFGYPDFQDYRTLAKSLTGVAAEGRASLSFSRGDVTERLTGRIVSGNYFSVLGVKPVIGRLLEDADERERAPNVVLSYRLWERAFDRSSGVLGSNIEFSGHSFTVVGVASKDFAGTTVGSIADVWLPVTLQPTAAPMSPGALENRAFGWLNIFGRLQSGQSLAQAQAEIDSIAASLAQSYPDTNAHRTAKVFPGLGMDPEAQQKLRTFLGLLLGSVLLLLLIACANVSSLLLARGVGRRREIAVRIALGASFLRIAGQLFIEALMVTSIAAIAGLNLALLTSGWIVAWQPSSYGLQNLDVTPDPRVFGFLIVISILTAGICTMAPLWQAAKTEISEGIKEGSPGSGRRTSRFQQILIAGQVALSLVLLAGAGLVIRTTLHVLTTDQGFETRNLAVFSLDLVTAGYSPERGREFYGQLLERTQALPGVVSASFASTVPPNELSGRVATFKPGEEPPKDILHAREIELGTRVDTDVTGPKYLQTMGITVVRGRDFTTNDRNSMPPVAAVNQRLAGDLWPGEDPIGKRLFIAGSTLADDVTVEIVGLCRDTKYRSLLAPAPAVLYRPLLQSYSGRTNLVVRTSMDPSAIVSRVMQEVHRIDRAVPVYGVETMTAHVAQSLWQQRIASTLIGLFGVVAALLASVGLYGVIAHSVAERTREIGIRVAVGANPGDIRRFILAQGFSVVAIGMTIGFVTAVAAGQLVRGLIYDISPHDPITLVVVSLLLAGVSLLAAVIPAQRATRIDPVTALRRE